MRREEEEEEEEKNLSLSLLRAVCGVRCAVCAVVHTNTGVTLLLPQVHTDRGVAGERVEEMGESGGTGRGTGHPRWSRRERTGGGAECQQSTPHV